MQAQVMKTKCNVFYGIIKNRTPRVVIPISKINYRQIPGIFSKYSSRGFAIGVTSDISPVLLVKATDFSLFLSFGNTETVFSSRLRSTFSNLPRLPIMTF
ncbi:hypothetical protein Mp_Mg00230 (mitochondrion) [Marchantia polymorpha subsp. ruderalis]|uniref:Uncharacterized protein n=2 Tax=Marchantia polymorpha TaxID=3197 RepID=A0A2Z6DTB9_MARPO|nr:hypothetical protein MpKit2_Mp013 [Marchantia polymorpha subsp. ruderalis]QBE89538.1 hypothetical protein [Marchantia polymorpha subsp. ruderalis]BBD75150.1 hypothetical protein MpKit2_Mp013 [Marchantia polymorpha subsp. ruderalis]BDD77333.1 hypothetical protein Mp_Mg00230 [Marchantia polymorpha subsp. ruderalis]